MRGKILFALFLFTALAVVVSMRTLNWKTHREPAVVSKMSESTAAPKSPVQSPVQLTEAQPNRVPQAENLEASDDPQFQTRLREEAKSLDDLHVDGEQKAAQMQAWAKQLTPAQSHQLARTVNQPAAHPGEKIISAYLLVEGGAVTREALKESIVAPLQSQEPHDAHSEGEINGVREKSLRIMMIDGLYAQGKTDPKARQTLAETIADSGDPYIKAYAQQKLDQLSKQ